MYNDFMVVLFAVTRKNKEQAAKKYAMRCAIFVLSVHLSVEV